MNWRCPECKVENEEGMFCSNCGTRRADAASALPSRTVAPASGAPVLTGRSILEEVKSEIAASFKQGRSPALRMPDMGLKTPDVLGKRRPAFDRVTTRDLNIKINLLPRLNYALAHSGLPFIPELEIKNASGEPAQDVLIKAWIATDYGEPWQRTLPSIAPGESHVEKNIVIPLQKSRLQQVREAEKANLRVDIYTEGSVQVSETVPVEVLAYNEWYFHPDFPALMACFVQPNSEAVEKIISLVRDRLRLEYRDTSLDGYQSGDRKKIVQMLEALYNTLQKDLQLTYINPPPSFEKSEMLDGGRFTMSQKIFFPELILQHRRGTCLDLALLCAACVERMGLNPLCFLVKGHAFFGVWLSENALQDPVVKDVAAVGEIVSSGEWLPLNSTTFAVQPQRRFSDCREEGRYCLENMDFICAIDVCSARYSGFKPIPPLISGV
jgi:hypothetical protein